MFEDKKITKEKVKDLLYNVQNEILNELDFDYESRFKKDITKNDLEMLMEFMVKFVNKLELTIDDEFKGE